LGPNSFEVDQLTAGKKIVIFALPVLSPQRVQQSMFLVL